MMRGLAVIRRLGALPIYLAVLWGMWMLLVDTVSVAELAACAAAAAIGTLAAVLVKHEGIAELSEHRVFLTALPKQLVRVPVDLLLLVRELGRALVGRHPTGRFHELPFEGSDDPRENARRAAVELWGSLAPNTIVLGVDEEKIVVHQLAAHASDRTAVREMAP